MSVAVDRSCSGNMAPKHPLLGTLKGNDHLKTLPLFIVVSLYSHIIGLVPFLLYTFKYVWCQASDQSAGLPSPGLLSPPVS